MENKERFARLVDTADLVELCSVAFDYPTPQLVKGVVEGTFFADWRECCSSLGLALPAAVDLDAIAREYAGQDPAELFETLREAYSLLYLIPRDRQRIFLYESAFLYKADGNEGVPTLFRSRSTLEVDEMMASMDVVPTRKNQDPSDSIYAELEFLSFLLTRAAAAVMANDQARYEKAIAMVESFAAKHVLNWVPAFLGATHERSQGFYGIMAQLMQPVFEKETFVVR